MSTPFRFGRKECADTHKGAARSVPVTHPHQTDKGQRERQGSGAGD
uniref:Uncharacterized protein n=1 Tax=viral metagenome TaxID=1070528 RepID=A0A6M3LSD6_9ZZZZ